MEYIENEFLKIGVEYHGAELSSIYDKKRDKELLWQADPAFWKRHAPILFPFVGKLRTFSLPPKRETFGRAMGN